LSFQIELKGQEVILQIKQHIDDNVDNMLKLIMADSLLKINSLVNSGRNVFNDTFQPYSQSYIKYRVKKGLGSRPNMQNTSSMMNSLKVTQIRKNSYQIGVSGTDMYGESNALKMHDLEQHKNYKILFWSDILKKIIDRYWEQFTV